jgi:hypothetical protein
MPFSIQKLTFSTSVQIPRGYGVLDLLPDGSLRVVLLTKLDALQS